jgi:DNA polymerase I
MASQNPNLQNIPIKTEYGRRIRGAFVADKGNVLVALDYSQIELRIAAGLSGDENLCEVFRSGGDVHTAVASRVFQVPAENVDREMRRRAKVINFGILYGMGVNALRANLGSEVSRTEAGEFLDNYFKTFSGLAEFLEKTKRNAEQNGYTETLFGRRRYFEGFKSHIPGMRAQAERMAINAPFQGTNADIVKIAMVRADALIEKHQWRDPSTSSGQAKVKLALQVHDELIYEMHSDEVEKATSVIKEAMESVVSPEKLHGVPIIVEAKVGHNWGEMKKV